MRTARKPKRLRPQAKSFQECLREFLTPAVWKQAQQARGARRESARWKTQTLVLVLLTMTWCCGDSTAERFETAKAVTAALLPKRKRPGKSVQGFQMALAKLPLPVLRAVGVGIRRALLRLLKDPWLVNGFVPLGCDGSRIECPRSAELEQRLGKAGKDGSAPTIWITALVHVRLGVPWAWRWGKGNASERGHLVQLIRHVPKAALVIADAGYIGFDLARTLAAAEVSFLIRLSSVAALYTEGNVPGSTRFREGQVYYWAPRKTHPPLPVRLIRVRGKKKGDVWLMTNVMEKARLSHAQAGQFYRWRWENEGLFRTYKRTLSKVKLMSRSVRLAHREAEGAMLATQLLLAQGTWRMRPACGVAVAACSARKVLLAVRGEIATLSRSGGRREPFGQRLRDVGREHRPARTSAKARREWPRPRPTTPPKPPRILKLTVKQQRVIHQRKQHCG